MRVHPPRPALALVLAASFLSCSENPIRPKAVPAALQPRATTVAVPQIVISQVYGGGGNSGATLKNDFIELHNASGGPVSVNGWSVQYASATGSSWQVTPISGTIPAGGYYLVKEAAGNGGTVDLPAPDALGGIAMGATAGKVVLVPGTTASTGTCPTVVDAVSYGTTATNCGAGTTASLGSNNNNAVIRQGGGCAYTGSLSADFLVATAAPRNSAAPVSVCPGVLPVGPLDHVLVAGPSSVTAGKTIQLTATPQDASNQTILTATITGWSSSDESVARVDATGTVTGVSDSPLPVTITATAEDNGITKSGSRQVTVNPAAIAWIDLSSSSSSFPAGFQTQLFATARTGNGGDTIKASFTFLSGDPQIATVQLVQNTGIITGVTGSSTKPGVTVTAVPIAGGAPYSHTFTPVTIETPVAAQPGTYAQNDEFGDPTPAGSDPNDMLIVRPGYTLSYNQARGTPNWVSYELDSRQIVAGQDRCNCFTADPLLPPQKQIFTSDYTNGGYDRGHMAKSADRTATNLENASTFYLTNIVPQMADLNQGVWAQFENALSDSARAGRAVYIITGPLYSRSHGLTFLKNEGKVAVPDSTWKVAVIGPRSGGAPFVHGDLASWSALDGVTVLAVNMPNVAGIRNDPWSKYATTVDRIEEATGYDIFSLLAEPFQDALEAGDHAPVPQFAVTGLSSEGATLTFDASASTDPDLGRAGLGRTEGLTYTWHFSDGASASGAQVTHAFADNGSYTATLTVADAFGWEESATQTLSIANVAPQVTLAATSLSILSGDVLSVHGSFTDPGPDAPWNAVIDWGNGTTTPLGSVNPGTALTGSAAFLAAGDHTVTLSVTDKDQGSGSASVVVTVDRRQVPGDAKPNAIDAAETDGDLMVTLQSVPQADVSTLSPASVRIEGVGLSAGKKIRVKDHVKGGTTITLRFARQELIDAGVLTPSTTELVVTGELANGVQIVAHVPVSVH